jgi:hypothetical protein
MFYKGKKIADKFFPSDLFAKPHFLFFVKLYTEEDPLEHGKAMEMIAKVRDVGFGHSQIAESEGFKSYFIITLNLDREAQETISSFAYIFHLTLLVSSD